MSNFNNDVYQCLAADLLGNVFYTDTSYRGKISIIRQYAEIVVRKILDVEPDKQITLGQHNIQDKIELLPNHEFLQIALETIRGDGNLSTHTQCLETFTKDDFEKILNSLFDMLSYLLINYFEKYEFGTRNEVLYSFSMLPPIIRYKTLNFLHKKHPENIAIIDKLVLAIMKAFNVNEATKWVESEKDKLVQMKTMTEGFLNELTEKFDVEVAELLKSTGPANMYLLCKDKIEKVGATINNNGLMYSDFESALPYYKERGILSGDNLEIQEFNDIMQFLYLGRKEKLQKVSKEENPYIILNCIS